jgi:hypothetical protein
MDQLCAARPMTWPETGRADQVIRGRLNGAGPGRYAPIIKSRRAPDFTLWRAVIRAHARSSRHPPGEHERRLAQRCLEIERLER